VPKKYRIPIEFEQSIIYSNMKFISCVFVLMDYNRLARGTARGNLAPALVLLAASLEHT